MFQNYLLIYFLKSKNTTSASSDIILKSCNVIWLFNESVGVGLSLCFSWQYVSSMHYILNMLCIMFLLLQFHVVSYFLTLKNCLFTSSRFTHNKKDACAFQDLNFLNHVLPTVESKYKYFVIKITFLGSWIK